MQTPLRVMIVDENSDRAALIEASLVEAGYAIVARVIGRADLGQLGDYQNLDQRAWAYGVEAGYRLVDTWAKPWMRLGINSGSGDTNLNDGT
ncbi:MAG TPA: alginate export family protein, partial [Candidatus Dormibacteraeota bacterium]|nr:alginate export family protein [Candidatus Dormibacteraeota bacterium]